MKRKVCFPHIGNYGIAFRPLAELFGNELIVAPPITKRTLELGSVNSPDSVCVPFKYILGTYIEALEKGANVLLQGGGGCRLGFYGEVQEEILKNMGYEFEFIGRIGSNFMGVVRHIKRINPEESYWNITKMFYLTYKKISCLDFIEDYMRKNMGFEENKGDFEKKHKQFLKDLDKADTAKKVRDIRKRYLSEFRKIRINKPKKLLRVGIVGELYTLMEPFSNFFVEKELAKKGIEVHRFVTLSDSLWDNVFLKRYERRVMKHSRPYLKYTIQGHGTETVARTNELIKEGFDGIIHIKPFGCMPEVSAMSVLHRISREKKFPIIYFSFDEQTSETGVKTRLEAFYDMMIMRRKKYAKN
jgi:predicted nucleotide-binding protein (sugar kinase/HSP70/actin superfamily)